MRTFWVKIKEKLGKLNNLRPFLKHERLVRWHRIWCKLPVVLVQIPLKSIANILAYKKAKEKVKVNNLRPTLKHERVAQWYRLALLWNIIWPGSNPPEVICKHFASNLWEKMVKVNNLHAILKHE